jgi:hypothetical protein
MRTVILIELIFIGFPRNLMQDIQNLEINSSQNRMARDICIENEIIKSYVCEFCNNFLALRNISILL